MAISKVEFGGQTLMDLTEDTVSEENLLEGETAHNAKGEKVIGGAKIPDKLSQLENDMEFKPVKELTVEEFEALPEGKDEEEVIYFIKDAVPPDSPLITEERIEGIEGNLTELGTEVAGNAQDIAAFNGTVTSLSGTVAQHETDISALETTTAQHGTDISALESGKADIDGIVLTGDVTGTSAFNAETGMAEIKTKNKTYVVGPNGSSSNFQKKWFKIASLTVDINRAVEVVFDIESILYSNAFGRLKAFFRSTVNTEMPYFIWENVSASISPNLFLFLYKKDENVGKYHLLIYVNITSNVWDGVLVTPTVNVDNFIFYDSRIGEDLPSDYIQIPDTLATIQNPVGALAWSLFGYHNLTVGNELEIDISTVISIAHEFLLIVGIPNGTSQIYGGKTYIIPNRDSELNIVSDKYYYSANYSSVSNTGMIRNSIFYANLRNNILFVNIKDDGPLRLRLYWR